MTRVEILGDPTIGADIGDSPVIIGRAAEVTLRLAHDNVSRRHAMISKHGARCAVQDLGSRNGTMLNGARIEGVAALQDGDIIGIGASQLTFRESPANAGVVDMRLTMNDRSTIAKHSPATVKASAAAEPKLMRPEDALRAVKRVTSLLTKRLSIESLLSEVLDTVLEIFPAANSGVVMLLDQNDELQPTACRGRACGNKDVQVSHTVLRHAMEQREAVLSTNVHQDDRFESSVSIAVMAVQSLMCAPLLDSVGKPLGVIEVQAVSTATVFSAETLDLLLSVAQTTAMAIENTRLNEQRLVQDRIDRDLLHAREVQRSLLPSQPPSVPGYEFFSYYESAASVGGDYYGYIFLPENQLAIGVGDVSGKGMSAAMMMARLSSDVRSALLQTQEPAAALISVNHWLSESQLDNRFVTMLLMVLEWQHHELQVANAGHPPALLRRRDGSIEQIRGGRIAPPLNVTNDPAMRPCATTVVLQPGDLVLAYTDGVSEARNTKGEEFGEARIHALLQRTSGGPNAVGKNLVAALETFTNGCRQMDDTTIACFGRAAATPDSDLENGATMVIPAMPPYAPPSPQ